MPKKTIIFIVIAILIVATAITYPLFIKQMLADATVSRVIAVYAPYNSNLREAYQHVLEKQKIFDETKEPTVEQHLSLGFNWKSLGDEVRNAILVKYRLEPDPEGMAKEELILGLFQHRALDVYEGGIKKFKKINSILYLNAGNVWRDLGHLENNMADYEKAEKRYLQALELDSGDPNNHLILIELYKNELKKPEAFIKSRYDKASKTVVNNIPIAISFAAYVRGLGQYEKALEFYQALYDALKRPEYKRAIEEIKVEMLKTK